MKNVNFTLYLNLPPNTLHKCQRTTGWALSSIGLIIYGVLRLFRQKAKDYKGICPYFEIGKNWGGVSLGWFFICCKNCGDQTKKHEVGHLIQNAAVGGLKMLAYSIGSAARYWWREIFGAKTPYDSWFFEGDATRLGTEYVHNIEKENKE